MLLILIHFFSLPSIQVHCKWKWTGAIIVKVLCCIFYTVHWSPLALVLFTVLIKCSSRYYVMGEVTEILFHHGVLASKNFLSPPFTLLFFFNIYFAIQFYLVCLVVLLLTFFSNSITSDPCIIWNYLGFPPPPLLLQHNILFLCGYMWTI